MGLIQSQIELLRKEFIPVETINGKTLGEIYQKINSATDTVQEFEKLWIGGWGQENYDHYRNPDEPRQAIQISADYIYKQVEKVIKTTIDKIGDTIDENLVVYQKFQNHLVTELSIIKDTEGFKSESEILQSIEKFKWGIPATEYVKYRRPNNIVVYNYEVLNKGLLTPPHIAVAAVMASFSTQSYSASKFGDLVKRILRQMEIKTSSGNSPQEIENYSQVFLQNVFDNFHNFYTQLRNRHASRSGIIIQDEYDVQDLLHAILKLNFRDVRDEEYTPSYAGSSSRMDFLLKNENIVIEVKKTRDRLAGKEVGEQLILNVNHYRNHPNCSILKCFVYDPENRIGNPRGLEDDINKLSDDIMTVELYIRP